MLGGRYDLFRDELYFIVCGQHPAFGYVDQPAGVPLIAATLYRLGLGAWGVRLPTAIAAGALVWLAARLARLLDGDRLAIGFAALACAIAPMLMGLTATLNTSAFDPLAWTAVAFLLLKAIRRQDDRRQADRALVLAGLIVGLALEIKYAIVFWTVGLAVGLLLTPQRGLLLRPALWIGVVLAAAIALPSFIWQAVHGFPFLELTAAAKTKNTDVPIGAFLGNQILVMNPALAPLWAGALVAPFVVERLRDTRFIAVAVLVVAVIVRAAHGKDYYLAPVYPTLFVLGAVALAPLRRHVAGKVAAGVTALAAIAISAVAAPTALPILSPAALAAYVTRYGLAPAPQERSFKGTVLPQLFADQLGWHDFTHQVEAAWSHVPVPERSATGIKVDNYGEAAALDLHGEGLPPALTGHNQYFLWGLRGQTPKDLLVVQHDLDALRPFCREVVPLGTTASDFAMSYENGKVIALCRGVTPPLSVLWPELKHYD